MQITNSQFKKYLLGDLDEQANEEIGVRIISDEATEDKLLIAENDLIEDFLEGNLSAAEEKLFHENFLICEDRRQQVSQINLFKQFAKNQFQIESPVENTDDSTESFWEKLKKLFGFNLRFAAPALAVLIIAVFGFYFFYPSNSLSPLEQEYAELNRKDFGNTNEFAKFSNVELISGTFRDSGAGNKLKAENLSDKIFFRLALPFNLSENQSLEVELLKDQKTIFRQSGVRVYKNQSGQEVRLLLPKEIFSKGRYRITIENPKAEDSRITYDFAVE
jgi:hypothetical protein